MKKFEVFLSIFLYIGLVMFLCKCSADEQPEGDVNRLPVLEHIGNKSVVEGELLTFTVTAIDLDIGDILTFSASSLPDGAAFDPSTQVFSWTPSHGDYGNYPNVRFTVEDDGIPVESDTEDITIIVNPAEDRIVNQFRNNLDVVLVSDPMILRDGDNYYLYATSEAAADCGFEVWQSDDMVNWRYKGFCFQKSESTWSAHDFWAPECVKADGIYYLYFSARDDVLFSQRRICVASSVSPIGPFTEVAAPLFDDGATCNIDAHLFKDGDGQMYMYYARQEWGIIPTVENQIWVVSMNSYTSASDDYTFCIKATQGWEQASYGGTIRWTEAPGVLKKDGIYYLMYSANCFNENVYAVGYATSSAPKGPAWTKYSGNPILQKTGDVSGPGHHCIINAPDGQMWIGYHSHVGNGGSERQLNIDKIDWSDNSLVVNGPTVSPQNYPNNAFVYSGSTDDFSGSRLDAKWHVVSEDPSRWSLATDPGYLVITAQDCETRAGSHDYKNMFLQHAPLGDFFIYTTVEMNTSAETEQADVYIWQDDDNYIRMAKSFAGGPKFEAAKEVNGSFSSTIMDNSMGAAVTIGIKKIGDTYSCWYRNNSEWVQVGSDMTVSLSPIKIGITAMSPGSGAAKKAYFNDFVLDEY